MSPVIATLLTVLILTTPAGAQDKPRYGGELIFAVPSEMPSYDGHREGTFGMVHPLAPHYNTLLRVDPNDRTGTKIVSDLAESSRDVKASYDKIVFPPPNVGSQRKGQYTNVEAIEAPDPSTIVFRLKWPQPSFLASLASA